MLNADRHIQCIRRPKELADVLSRPRMIAGRSEADDESEHLGICRLHADQVTAPRTVRAQDLIHVCMPSSEALDTARSAKNRDGNLGCVMQCEHSGQLWSAAERSTPSLRGCDAVRSGGAEAK